MKSKFLSKSDACSWTRNRVDFIFLSLKGLVEEDDWETAEQLIRKVWDFKILF